MVHDSIILGAGISGLAAAGILRRAGREVIVLEKSRGLGGRAATRRWEGLPVDHGAQFFTARSDKFRAQVAHWLAQGVCREWTRGFHHFRGGRLTQPGGDNHPRYVCREGMSALGRALVAAGNINVECQAKVTALAREDAMWILSCQDGRAFRAENLVITSPPPQGAILLQSALPEAAGLLRGIAMEPCLAIAARFPRREMAWRGIQAEDAGISWIGHDTSKRPGLHGDKTIAVVHASPTFSRDQYESPEQDVVDTLLARASEISGSDLRGPEAVFLQRWRYAQTTELRAGEPAVFYDAPAPLVLAGESFAGGKIEGAWLSGVAAGKMILRRIVGGDAGVM